MIFIEWELEIERQDEERRYRHRSRGKFRLGAPLAALMDLAKGVWSIVKRLLDGLAPEGEDPPQGHLELWSRLGQVGQAARPVSGRSPPPAGWWGRCNLLLQITNTTVANSCKVGTWGARVGEVRCVPERAQRLALRCWSSVIVGR